MLGGVERCVWLSKIISLPAEKCETTSVIQNDPPELKEVSVFDLPHHLIFLSHLS